MPKCAKCGADVPEQATACPNCGAAISTQQEKPAAVAQAPSPEPSGKPEVIWEGRYSLADMNVIWIYTLLITVVFVVLGIFGLQQGWKPQSWSSGLYWGIILLVPIIVWLIQAYRALERSTIRYKLTPARLYRSEGIFVRKEEALELVGIEDISTRQNLIERFICGGVGRVLIHSRDKTDPVLIMRGLKNYQEAFYKIDEARKAERQRRGLTLI